MTDTAQGSASAGGWSPERSKHLARACLDALHGILPTLQASLEERR